MKSNLAAPAPTSLKIAVLGIGTELTSGQILNRNGQWISQRMKDLGVQTSCHLVVPDDRPLILEALQFCFERADVLFVTGGLGPTSDDFTRDMIAQWTARKTFFHESSWTHINERLSQRGIIVREIQRQQCYYPEGSEVLFNRNGTANAFTLKHSGKDVYVLPGPPKEIEGVWNEFIDPVMKERCIGNDKFKTHSWDCMGVGESEISHLAEAALRGRPEELSLDIGYRVHLPYVEFKISYFESLEDKAKPWIAAVDKALAPHCVLKEGADAAEILSEKLKSFSKIILSDSLSGPHLLQRLFPFIKPLLGNQQIQFGTEKMSESVPASTLVLSLEKAGASAARVSLKYKGQTITNIFETAYDNALMKERELQYFTEQALIFWMKQVPAFGNVSI